LEAENQADSKEEKGGGCGKMATQTARRGLWEKGKKERTEINSKGKRRRGPPISRGDERRGVEGYYRWDLHCARKEGKLKRQQRQREQKKRRMMSMKQMKRENMTQKPQKKKTRKTP